MSLMHQLFLQVLRESETHSRASFDQKRMPLLARLLDHVWREVPAYRDRIAPLLDADGFDLARWTELPPLRPADVEGLGERLFAAGTPAGAGDVEPVSAASHLGADRRSRLARVAEECERERAYERFGLDLSGRLAILHPDLGGPTEGEGWSWTFSSSPWVAGDQDGDPARLLSWLSASGAPALRTSLKLARMLATEAIASKPPDTLRTVIIDDVSIDAEIHHTAADVFHADVCELLCVNGVGVVASRRGKGDYAVAAGSIVAEVVDGEGRPCVQGELVVTPLYEYCRPLLRLATGIAAVALDEPSTALGVRRLARIGDATV